MQESVQVCNHFQVVIFTMLQEDGSELEGFVVLEKGQVIVQKIPG
jgi:hypothetical protein